MTARTTTTARKRKARLPRRYRGRSADELRAERRQRLMAAGLKLFARRGYANSPIELICATAHVATRHFYEHFASREALLSAIYDDLTAQGRTVIQRAIAEGPADPVESLVRAVRAFVEFYLSNPDMARVGSLESVGVSRELEQYRRRAIHEFADLIAANATRLAEAGLLPRRDYRLPAVALVGATDELVVEWLTSKTGLTPQELAREIAGLYRTMIVGAQQFARERAAVPVETMS